MNEHLFARLNPKAQGAIGVFDSGVGGLSVLQAIAQQLPAESLCYVADNAHIPYGEKSPAFIVSRCEKLTEFLLAQQCKAIVVACNTATAAAIASLRQRYPSLVILGMEPAIKPAAAATRNGKIGVLATTGTLRSSRFAALLGQFASHIEVVSQACPGLVEQIEAGLLTDEATVALLERYLAPILAHNCDTLILGCTHYPFLKPLLKALLPPSVSLIETGPAVATHLTRRLEQAALLAPVSRARAVQFYSSAHPAAVAKLMPVLWGTAARVQPLPASYRDTALLL